MKKNNTFLLAYIIVIFACTMVRLFWDYPMWSNIVIAVTISSAFFAFSDLYRQKSNSLTELTRKQTEDVERGIFETEQIKKNVQVLISQNEEQLSSNSAERQKLSEHFESASKRIEVIMNSYLEMKNQIPKASASANRCRIVSEIIELIGFVSLFAVMIFEPVAAIFEGSQDVLTVISFAVILSTGYMKNYTDEKTAIIVENSKRIHAGLETLKHSYKNEIEHNKAQKL